MERKKSKMAAECSERTHACFAKETCMLVTDDGAVAQMASTMDPMAGAAGPIAERSALSAASSKQLLHPGSAAYASANDRSPGHVGGVPETHDYPDDDMKRHPKFRTASS